MAGCGATDQQDIAPAKEFLPCFVCCGGAVEIGETEFTSRRFLRVRLEFGMKNSRPIEIEESFD